MSLVDSHAHLDAECFEEDFGLVLQRAAEEGVSQILTVGCLNAESGETRAIEIVESGDNLFAAFGVHPHDASCYDDAVEDRLLAALGHQQAIALGEIGLDFYYDNSPRDQQISVFRRQVELARDRGLPIIVHSRDAEAETLEVLREGFGDATDRPGVIHCFTGSAGMANACIEMGFFIGFGGILTFKRADELRSIAAEVPVDRLLIETDCPYLAPVPMRGKRNEPAFVKRVAEQLAELRGVSLEKIAEITSRNFSLLFRL